MAEITFGKSDGESGGKSGGVGMDIDDWFRQLESAIERMENNPRLARAILGDQATDLNMGEMETAEEGEPALNAQNLETVMEALCRGGFGDRSINAALEWVRENPDEVDKQIQAQF